MMEVEQLFGWAGQVASCGWFILVLLPRNKALIFIAQYLLPLGLSALYGGLMLTHFFSSDGGYSSLAAVKALFENDYILLAGWVHYLAFDLFVGSWIARHADEISLSRLLQAPILIATFMFGPLGLGLFLFMRATMTQAAPVQSEENHHAY
jgi:hypothetical protein